jgi:hypothetical protein
MTTARACVCVPPPATSEQAACQQADRRMVGERASARRCLGRERQGRRRPTGERESEAEQARRRASPTASLRRPLLARRGSANESRTSFDLRQRRPGKGRVGSSSWLASWPFRGCEVRQAGRGGSSACRPPPPPLHRHSSSRQASPASSDLYLLRTRRPWKPPTDALPSACLGCGRPRLPLVGRRPARARPPAGRDDDRSSRQACCSCRQQQRLKVDAAEQTGRRSLRSARSDCE